MEGRGATVEIEAQPSSPCSPDDMIRRHSFGESARHALPRFFSKRLRVSRTEAAFAGVTSDAIRDKVTSQNNLGLVSALLAGFSLSSMLEVDVSNENNAVASLYLLSVTCSLSLGILVVVVTSLQFSFIMTQMRYDPASVWNMLEGFQAARRVGEIAFILSILFFGIAIIFAMHLTFADARPQTTTACVIVFSLVHGTTICLVMKMQFAKKSASKSSLVQAALQAPAAAKEAAEQEVIYPAPQWLGVLRRCARSLKPIFLQ